MIMRIFPLCLAIFSLTCFLLGEASAQTPLEDYLQTRAKWVDHLGETIPVLDLSSNDGQTEQTRLTARLEALQNKKVSNREWHEYWQEQARLADAVQAQLSVLTLDQIDVLRAELNASLRTLREKTATPKMVLAQAVARLRNEVRKLGQTNGRIEAQLERVRETLAKLARTSVALDKEMDAQQQNSLKLAIEDTERKIERLTKDYQKNEAQLVKKETALEAFSGDLSNIPEALTQNDPALKKALNQLKTQAGAHGHKKLDKLQQKVMLLDRLSRRRLKETVFAKQWSTLAHAKVSSQDTYLAAIEGELEAVEERLKAFENKVTPKTDEDNQDHPCRPQITSKRSPYESHRRCIEHLNLGLQRLAHQKEQTAFEQAMYIRFTETNQRLIEAQRKDVELVRREQNLSQKANEMYTKESQDVEREWQIAWQAYTKRNHKKVLDLETALRASKKDKRVIKAKLAVFAVALDRLDTQLASQRSRLLEQNAFSRWSMALLLTALSIVKVGWPALVYLFIAFVLIRLVRRFRDRKEVESETLDKAASHAQIKALEDALEKAQNANNEARVMELHEEIGRIESQLKDQGQRMATIARVAAQAVTLVIYIATSLLVLDALTVDIGPILGGAAIFGLAISFGSQSLVKDVVSGFFILLENQYAVGDVVTINGQSGTVEKITLRRTVLRSIRGEVHNLTNGSISSVTNMTQGWARVVINLGVAYGTDIDFVKDVVNTVGAEMYQDEEWRDKLTEKPAYVGVTGFGESEVLIRAWCKTKTFQNWGVERELNLRLKTAFEEAGIEIPFPKRDVNLVVQTQSSSVENIAPLETNPSND